VENVALVGAGLIGIEMAEALIERGLNVTMLEMFDWFMPALLDEEMGRLAGKRLRAKGVNLAVGSAATEFVKDGNGNLAAVKTAEKEYQALGMASPRGSHGESGLGARPKMQHGVQAPIHRRWLRCAPIAVAAATPRSHALLLASAKCKLEPLAAYNFTSGDTKENSKNNRKD